MKRLTIVAVAALALAVGACTDKVEQAAPTAPTAVRGPSLSVSGDSTIADGPAGESTACVAYREKRDDLNVQLAAKPGDADLAESVAMYDGVIAENCK